MRRVLWIRSFAVVATLCTSFLLVSMAQAADRGSGRFRVDGQRVAADASAPAGQPSTAPLTLHRLWRQEFRNKLFRFLREVQSDGGMNLSGLSDDPDPTGNSFEPDPNDESPPGEVGSGGDNEGDEEPSYTGLH